MAMPRASIDAMKDAVEAVVAAIVAARVPVDIALLETGETYIETLKELAKEIREESLQRQAAATGDLNKVSHALTASMTEAVNATGMGFVHVEGAAEWQRNLEECGRALIEAKAALMRADTAAEKVVTWTARLQASYTKAEGELMRVLEHYRLTEATLGTCVELLEEARGMSAKPARERVLHLRSWLAKLLEETAEQRETFMSAWQTVIEATQGNDPPSFSGVKDGLVTVEAAFKATGSASHRLFMALLKEEER